jgi:hypothetical protein
VSRAHRFAISSRRIAAGVTECEGDRFAPVPFLYPHIVMLFTARNPHNVGNAVRWTLAIQKNKLHALSGVVGSHDVKNANV